MEKPRFLAEFLVYIGENPEITPTERFECRAMHADEPPTFFNTMPKGDLFVYPSFLVFLTLNETKPGHFLLLKELVQDVVSQLKTISDGPEAIIVDSLKAYFSKHYSEEELYRAMTNPNSFCMPVSGISDVQTGFKLTQGGYLKVALKDANFILYRELSRIPIKTVYQLVMPTWRNFIKMLRQVAQKNTLRER